MTAHDHATFVDGCFRCDLSRDEVAMFILDAGLSDDQPR